MLRCRGSSVFERGGAVGSVTFSLSSVYMRLVGGTVLRGGSLLREGVCVGSLCGRCGSVMGRGRKRASFLQFGDVLSAFCTGTVRCLEEKGLSPSFGGMLRVIVGVLEMFGSVGRGDRRLVPRLRRFGGELDMGSDSVGRALRRVSFTVGRTVRRASVRGVRGRCFCWVLSRLCCGVWVLVGVGLGGKFCLFADRLAKGRGCRYMGRFFRVAGRGGVVICGFGRSFLPPVLSVSLGPVGGKGLSSASRSSVCAFFRSGGLVPFCVGEGLVRVELGPKRGCFGVCEPLLARGMVGSRCRLLPYVSSCVSSDPVAGRRCGGLLYRLRVMLGSLAGLFGAMTLRESGLVYFKRGVQGVVVLTYARVSSVVGGVLREGRVRPVGGCCGAGSCCMLTSVLGLGGCTVEFRHRRSFKALAPFGS